MKLERHLDSSIEIHVTTNMTINFIAFCICFFIGMIEWFMGAFVLASISLFLALTNLIIHVKRTGTLFDNLEK